MPNATAHVKVKTYQNSATKIEVTIPLKNVTLRAEERHDDLYAGIDLINSKLERQVRKYKTRVNRKNRKMTNKKLLHHYLKNKKQKIFKMMTMIVKLRLFVQKFQFKTYGF